MPIISCPTKNDCRGPGQSGSPFDPSNPFANLSAEAPDEDVFIGIDYDRRTDPPLGSSWTTAGCQSTCLSTISQSDADLCAARQAILCNGGDWQWPSFPRGTCPEGTVYDPSTNSCVLPVFFNTPQTCFSFCPDGQAFAFTQSFPAFAGFNQALVNAQALSYACGQAAQRRVCLSDLSPREACMNSGYVGQIAVSGNAPASITIIAGSLPPGITANQSNSTSPLVLSGTPTSDGDYQFTVRAQTAALDLMDKNYTLSVVTILNDALTEATIDEPYSFSLTVGGTPTGSLTWALISGTLPDGLTLDASSGVISGTPTVAGDYAFTIGFSNSVVTQCAKELTLTVEGGFEWDLVWGAENVNLVGTGGTHSFTGLPASSDLSATNNANGRIIVDVTGTQNVVLTEPVSIRAILNGAMSPDGPDNFYQCQFSIDYDGNVLTLVFLDNPATWVNHFEDSVIPAGTWLISVGVRVVAFGLAGGSAGTAQFTAALSVLP